MDRKTFLKSATAISTFTVLSPHIAFGYKANSAIRMGVIGCGNRGTAVISSILKHTGTAITAMADLLGEKLQAALPGFNAANKEKGLPGIQPNSLYQGSEAYLKLLSDKNVDAVLISSPAYTHADFLTAAAEAGKHFYCEKPVSPDVYGCRKAEKTGAEYDGRLSMAIGFQIRYASPYVEMVRRIRRGDIGDIVSAALHYISSAGSIRQKEGISFDEARIRNHFHFRALSGGILLDQGIHMLDVCNWALKLHPESAVGSGSAKGAPSFGDAWSNYQVIYRYPDNIHVTLHSTQTGPVFGDVCARFMGTEGIAEAHYSGGVFIKGKNSWDSGILKYEGAETTEAQRQAGIFLSSLHDADANKDIAFIESIESGNYINEVQPGVNSTLSAILGRNSAISGQGLQWDEVYTSGERLDPELDLSQFDV
jgi:myo-inositol 2-dehydrogenase/D-chiro-inositol 1-dehydrogenase